MLVVQSVKQLLYQLLDNLQAERVMLKPMTKVVNSWYIFGRPKRAFELHIVTTSKPLIHQTNLLLKFPERLGINYNPTSKIIFLVQCTLLHLHFPEG